MICGIGIDIAEIERIRHIFERFGKRFTDKILTSEEQKKLSSYRDPAPHLATLWAAKEAGAKALGTGFSHGIHPQCFEIIHSVSGKPEIQLRKAALAHAKKLGVTKAHISLSHEKGISAATVILEG